MTTTGPAVAQTMRALVLEEFGAPLELRSVSRPVPQPGEVLVRIAASGVNPLDTKIRLGAAPHARVHVPAILGMDLAGAVTEVGPGVSRFKSGDETSDAVKLSSSWRRFSGQAAFLAVA